jgi:uncharacterized protein (UPF0332 family)
VRDAVLRLARHRLERAREALKDGQLLLAQGSLTSAMNRVYYAAFYGARAVLATREVDSSRHSGVIALFQKHFVKAGLFDAGTAKALPRAFEKRQTSDYGDFAILTAGEVERVRDDVSVFVEACAQLVERASGPEHME